MKIQPLTRSVSELLRTMCDTWQTGHDLYAVAPTVDHPVPPRLWYWLQEVVSNGSMCVNFVFVVDICCIIFWEILTCDCDFNYLRSAQHSVQRENRLAFGHFSLVKRLGCTTHVRFYSKILTNAALLPLGLHNMNTVLAADGNYANITPSEDILTKYANVNMTCICEHNWYTFSRRRKAPLP